MLGIRSIVKRKNRFHYRRRLPLEIARQLGRSHVWKTLGTSDIRCAVLRSNLFDKVILTLTNIAINVNLNVSVLSKILDDGLNNALTNPITSDLLMGDLGTMYPPYHPTNTFLNIPDEPHDQSEGGEQHLTHKAVQPMCGTRLSDEQGYKFLKGVVGFLGQTHEPQGTSQTDIQFPPLGGRLIDGPTIKNLLGNYVSEMSSESWTPRTRTQNERTLSLFTEFLGDKPIGAVSRTDVSRFVDEVLRKLPRTYGKSPKDHSKRWSELVVENPTHGLSTKTIGRHLTSLSGLFTWAERRGYIPQNMNPVKGFKIGGKKRRPRDERQAWTPGELRSYFNSPQYTGHKPVQRAKAGHTITKDARYWVPFICLFAGLRLEEAAQLRVEDIEEIDGIWAFSIREGEGRQLKSKAAVRKVPLHPRLIQLGLLDHWKAQVDLGHTRVFPDLSAGGPDGRYGYKLTQQLGTYRKQVGISRPGVDLHSLRGNFATALHDAGVPESIANELLGHENATMSYSRYSKGVSIKTLAEAIGKIEFGV